MVLSTAETLSQALADAIRRTREPRSDRFLPKADLDQILCHDSLIALYQKLFRIVVPQREPNDMLTSNPWIDNPSHDVIGYAQKTVKNPSRISLLALFLLDQREELLSLFKDWLSSDDAKFPSDEDLPLSADGRWLPGIGFHHWEYILEKQWIFLPFTITEQYYERVPRMCRKPFIGNPKEIKRGASGTVYKVKVAAGYWRDKKNDEYRTFSMDQLVAMKVFEDDKDYETERDFLQELRQNVSIHKRIVLDLGGLIYEDSEGKLCHSLFFELAICNLDEFLNKGDNRRFYASNGSVIAKAVDIVEALDFLHKKVRFLHLDLKPDNILIYESAEPGINDGRIWKLTDFNLAKRKIKVRSSSRERLELSNSDSTASTVPAGRGPALYQAPEIQVPGTSLASDESEVWSMGGILLVVLGFLYNPYSGAKRFRDSATVTFKDQGGERRSLYVTSKMHQWPRFKHNSLDYIDFIPEVGIIEDRLEATLHPDIMRWSNEVYDASPEPERRIVKDALCVIFMHVLLIDKKSRIDAAELHKKFVKIRDEYKRIEVAPNLVRPQYPQPTTETQEIQSPLVEVLISSSSIQVAPSESQTAPSNTRPVSPQTATAPPQEPAALLEGAVTFSEVSVSSTGMPMAEGSSEPSALCAAMSHGEVEKIRQLVLDEDLANKLCPRCRKYPIHKALIDANNTALEALLKPPSKVNIETKDSSRQRTPVQLACEGSGNLDALKLFRDYHSLSIDANSLSCTRGSFKVNKFVKEWQRAQGAPVAQPARQGSGATQLTTTTRDASLDTNPTPVTERSRRRFGFLKKQ